MGAELKVDLREFERVANLLIDTDKRTFPQFVNGQLLALSKEAMRFQKPAKRKAIEREMGVQSSVTTKRKSSKGKWVRITKRDFGSNQDLANSFAARIINNARRKAGLKMIWGEEMREAARKLVAQKVKSVGFLKAGWIEAMRSISKAVYSRGAGLSAGGQTYPRGYSIPAKVVFNGPVVGEIGNTVPGYRRKGGKNFPAPFDQTGHAWTGSRTSPVATITAALQKAVNAVTFDMSAKLAERLKRDWLSLKK